MQARHILTLIVGCAIAPQLAWAQGADRLSIHGYFSQGYATADGGRIFGIPENGTTDYGNAAIQFRYALSSNDYMVLQLAHRRLGNSTLVFDEDEVTVDWAFYGRRLGDLELKVGRIAIPAGIYNEIRDVGVLLPMFRAPFNFYLEGSFTSETVDGVVASYVFGADKPWSLELAAYGGAWDITDRTDNGTSYSSQVVRATGAVGGNIWINTPIEGLRAGGGVSRYDTHNVSSVGGLWKEWHASLDAQFPLFTAQSEYRYISFPNGHYRTYYGYLGVRPLPQLTLHATADYADVAAAIEFSGMNLDLDLDYNDEVALGASYAVSPTLVLKGEVHRSDGYWADAPVLNPVLAPPFRVDFMILSVSAAF